MPLELMLTAQRTIELLPYDDAPLTAGQVRAQALVSGISQGTELAHYRGISPFHGRRFDLDLRLFVEDAATGYPTRLGYEWVGTVEEVGEDVSSVGVGDLVHVTSPHRETQTFSASDDPAAAWLVLPPELAPERAALLQSTAIALQAVHDARIEVGERVAVFGLGAFGLLAVQLARLNGAAWIAAVDPVAGRRDLAVSLGADCALDPAADTGREIRRATGGQGVDVAIEFAGRYAALHEALRSVRLAGTVVAAGFYVGDAGSDLRLGEEFHHNRLTLVGSMSGWGAPQRQPGWHPGRLRTTALELLLDGRLDLDAFVTHRFPFARAARAYELIDSRPEEALRTVLDY